MEEKEKKRKEKEIWGRAHESQPSGGGTLRLQTSLIVAPHFAEERAFGQ